MREVVAVILVNAGMDRLGRDGLEPDSGRRAAARAPDLGLSVVDDDRAFELAAVLARSIAVGQRRGDRAPMAGLGVFPDFGLPGPVELERVLKRLLLMTPIGIGQQRIGRRRARPCRAHTERQRNRNRERGDKTLHETTPMP